MTSRVIAEQPVRVASKSEIEKVFMVVGRPSPSKKWRSTVEYTPSTMAIIYPAFF
jgi:hypothetical protein